jgi:RNA polymerase sigma-70 factor (ECF subfamily)
MNPNFRHNYSSGEMTLAELNSIMDSHSGNMYLFVLGIVRSREAAEEIVSDVFIRIWSKRDKLSINNIVPYLFMTARNMSVSHLRRSHKMKTVELNAFNEFIIEPIPVDDGETERKIGLLNEAISSLPAKCKMAFILAKVQGLKYREIGVIMNISEQTVQNHIAYAIKKLHERLVK